jgi:hypothetical protein
MQIHERMFAELIHHEMFILKRIACSSLRCFVIPRVYFICAA